MSEFLHFQLCIGNEIWILVIEDYFIGNVSIWIPYVVIVVIHCIVVQYGLSDKL